MPVSIGPSPFAKLQSRALVSRILLITAVTLNSTASFGQNTNESFPRNLEPLAISATQNYSRIVFASYSDLVKSTEALKTSIATFVAQPSFVTLEHAKLSWKISRNIYSQTEVFRFYGGPIDDAKTGVEGLMNAWPIDESYLDRVKDAPNGGLVFDLKTNPEVSKGTLLELNEKGGEKNVSTGYHAIEFFLWGQDFNRRAPGNRPHTDYLDDGKNQATRRAKVLVYLTEILAEHSIQLQKAWEPNIKGNYAALFEALPIQEKIHKITSGMAMLSMDEMAGERMTVALTKKDPENEQNCFSDYSLEDLVSNAQGIQNVWTGEYGTIKGESLKTLTEKLNPKLAAETTKAIAASVQSLALIPGPFDAVIRSPAFAKERKLANTSILNLELQAKKIAGVAQAVGVKINVQAD